MIEVMLHFICLILIGISIGLIAGFCPGIHVNTTIPFIVSLSFLTENSFDIAILIVSVSVTEMFADHIPSIFIGSPDADTSLCVLPSHRMLLEGRGYEALKLTVIGNLGSLVGSLIFIFLFFRYFEVVYAFSKPFIHIIILSVLAYMIVSEKKLGKMLSSLLILVLSGVLGVLCLNSSIVNQENVLFPVLTGLFGLSSMLISFSDNASIPMQSNENNLMVTKGVIIKVLLISSISGILVGFLPAVGISEAAVIVQSIGGLNNPRTFLMMTAGINSANDVFSMISLYLVGNPRSGASVAIEKLLGEPTFHETLLLIGVMMMVSGISACITLFLGKRASCFLDKINFRLLNMAVILLIVALVFMMTGFYGMLILITSTSIGVLCAYLEIRRSHCMGVMMIPTLLFFLDLNPIIISILNI